MTLIFHDMGHSPVEVKPAGLVSYRLGLAILPGCLSPLVESLLLVDFL